MLHSFYIMKRDWQLCPHEDKKRWTTLHVTIDREERINLSRFTVEKLGEPERVLLMYDARSHTIGLQPASSSAKNSFHVASHKKGGRIYAIRLLREFNLKITHTLLFLNAELDSDGILLLDLNNTRPVTRGENGRPRKVLVAEGGKH